MKRIHFFCLLCLVILLPNISFARAGHNYKVKVIAYDDGIGREVPFCAANKNFKICRERKLIMKWADHGKCPATSSYRSKMFTSQGELLTYWVNYTFPDHEEFCIIAPGYKSKLVRPYLDKDPLYVVLERR